MIKQKVLKEDETLIRVKCPNCRYRMFELYNSSEKTIIKCKNCGHTVLTLVNGEVKKNGKM